MRLNQDAASFFSRFFVSCSRQFNEVIIVWTEHPNIVNIILHLDWKYKKNIKQNEIKEINLNEIQLFDCLPNTVIW